MPIILPLSTYKLAYTHEFTTINGNECLLKIFRRETKKLPVIEIVGQDVSINIDFGKGSDDFFEPIKTKELTLRFWSEDNNVYDEFFEADNYQFYAEFYINNILNFKGWIIPDIHTEAFTTPPFQVSVKFGCGLFLLKDNTIDCPFERNTLLSFIRQCMNYNAFGFDILDCCNFFEESFDTLTGNAKRATLNNLNIAYETFRGKSYFDALKLILSSFVCEIHQYGDKWLIKRCDIIDMPGNQIQGVVYEQATGSLINTVSLTLRESITTPSTLPANRIAWVGGNQQVEFVEKPKRIDIMAPKEIQDNLFVTGSDFKDDCEFLNPLEFFPTPAQIRFHTTQANFNDISARTSERYFNYDFLRSNVWVLVLQSNGWRYYIEDDCKLTLNCAVSGYMNINDVYVKSLYNRTSNTFIYPVVGAFLPNNTPIVIRDSFGRIEGKQIYYVYDSVSHGLGVTFKLSRQKNAYLPMPQISNEDTEVAIFISPPHVSFEVNLFKNFTLAEQWTLSNNGEWFSQSTGQKLTVDLFIDPEKEREISQKLQIINLSFASNEDIPDTGFIYYKVKGVNTFDVFDTYFKSIKFEIRKSRGDGIELPRDKYLIESEISANNKEIVEQSLQFTDTDEYLNPHLIYKNYLSAIIPWRATSAWSLSLANFDYKHYELIEIILKRQYGARRAKLTGSITAIKDIMHKFLQEKNYKNAYFKPISIKFTPKYESYTGTWQEMYFRFSIDPVPGSGFDSSFDNSFGSD
jgi:hypothetical protein